jgi:hypothetical protein
MYAREENNEIVKYKRLPKEMFDGENFYPITEQNATLHGFYPLVKIEFDWRTHKQTDVIEWDGANTRYTYALESLNPTTEDIKKILRANLKVYWKEAFAEGKPYTDFLKATNQTMPTDVETKINALYGLLATIKAQINALDNLQDALEYELPMNEINEGLEYLRDLI